MTNTHSITLREFLLHSNLTIANDRNLWWWANSERDAVCVSFHDPSEGSGRAVDDPVFGRIVSYNSGRSIPLSCLDLPVNVDLM
jgi:hypothetical protein